MQLSQDTRLKGMLDLKKLFLSTYSTIFHIFGQKKIFKIKNGATVLPELFKLVGIVVLHPYDSILNYISAKTNAQWQYIFNSRLAQRKRAVPIPRGR